MNIWYLSDLHLEYRDYKLSLTGRCPPHASVLVLAGDIGNGIEAVEWMNRQQAALGIPVIFVPGNHDYFDYERTDMQELLAQMKASAAAGVHVLNNERIDLGGVHFLGTTLWTDYRYSDPPGRYRQEDLMRATALYPDYDTIYWGDRKFMAEDSVALHERARDWLETELVALRDQDECPRVVITHFLPSPRSIDPRFRGRDTNAGFCSQLPDALIAAADVWIHGHTHHGQDWRGPGGVRVLCNPLGYPEAGETPGFDFMRWVEL